MPGSTKSRVEGYKIIRVYFFSYGRGSIYRSDKAIQLLKSERVGSEWITSICLSVQ